MAVALSQPNVYAPPVIRYPARVYTAGETALGGIAFGLLWLFVFVMPWEESVPLLGGFVISRWVAIAAAVTLVLSILSTRQLRRISGLHMLMIALVTWAALTLLWTVDDPATRIRVGTEAQLLLAVWIIWELALTESRIFALLEAYAFGAGVLCVATIINYANGIQAADLDAEQGIAKVRDSRYTMYGVNANDLALMVALSVPIAIYLLLRGRGRWIKVYCWVHLGLSLATLFLVGSRGGLISTAVGLLLLPLLMPRMGATQRVALLLVLLAGIGLGVYYVPADVWTRLMATGSEISQGTMTHRTALWDAGLEAVRDRIWSGVGAGAYGTAIYKLSGWHLVAHNTWISVLVETGVPGLILFVSLIAGFFYTASTFRYVDRCFWTVVFFTWAVGVTALTWEYRKPTWLLFGLLAAHAYARRDAKQSV